MVVYVPVCCVRVGQRVCSVCNTVANIMVVLIAQCNENGKAEEHRSVSLLESKLTA